MLLKGKVVIISGIGPGLGTKLAVRAAEYQAKAVVLATRTPAKLDLAEKAIRDAGYSTPVLKVPTDIAQVEQCQTLADLVDRKSTRLNSSHVVESRMPSSA